MIIVDASALVSDLLSLGQESNALHHLGESGTLGAPEILVAEVLGGVRRLEHLGDISHHRAQGAVTDLLDLEIRLYQHRPLARRAFELRSNVTASDALYVALAEALDIPLLTIDGRLARAVRRHTAVKVLPGA